MSFVKRRYSCKNKEGLKMINVQKYINDKGFDALINDFSINKDETEDLVVLNYNQIDSPINAITNECRALILEKGTWNIVASAFNRFFNFNEGHASKIDFDSAKILEKVDGSLILLFNYKNKWRISTRGKLDAKGDLPFRSEEVKTFSDVIYKIFDEKKFNFENLDNDCTYIFELVSPFNRVVKDYKEITLYLLSIKNRNILQEFDFDEVRKFAEKNNFKTPKVFSFENYKDVLEKVNELPLGDEGFVVCDKNFNRIKIKSAVYFELHKAVSNGTPNLFSMILSGDADEFVSYFPIFKEETEKKKDFVKQFKSNLIELWETNKDIKERKEFALKVKDFLGSKFLFDAYSGKSKDAMTAYEEFNFEKKINFFERNYA